MNPETPSKTRTDNKVILQENLNSGQKTANFGATPEQLHRKPQRWRRLYYSEVLALKKYYMRIMGRAVFHVVYDTVTGRKHLLLRIYLTSDYRGGIKPMQRPSYEIRVPWRSISGLQEVMQHIGAIGANEYRSMTFYHPRDAELIEQIHKAVIEKTKPKNRKI